MLIKCPTGKIRIEKAYYGRTGENECTKGTTSTRDCPATIVSDDIVKRMCNDNTTCSVDVSNNQLGGDPCNGIVKYLEVNFTCV